jgi:hypothetical protein
MVCASPHPFGTFIVVVVVVVTGLRFEEINAQAC